MITRKKGLCKVVVLLMALVLCLGSLWGCSSGESESTESDGSDGSNESNEAEESNEVDEGNGDTISAADLAGKKVAFISAANQYDFFVYMGAKVKQIAEEYDITIDSFDAAADVTKEADLMTQAVLQKYDAIIMGPVDSEALVPSVQEAVNAGIPVINYDSFMENVDVHARIGSNNKELGKTIGEYAVEYLKEKYGKVEGKVIILTFPALETINSRISGFKEAFADYPDVVLQEEVVKNPPNAESGQLMTENLLIANEKDSIDVVFGPNAGIALGANAAVVSAGRSEIAVLGIDNEQGELDAIAEGGTFKATVAQDGIKIGEEAINAAIKAIQGEKTGDVSVPGVLVTNDNIEEYIASEKGAKEELNSYK